MDEKNVRADVVCVDVGNFVTHLGLFAGGELVGRWELTTPERCTADEAVLSLTQVLAALAHAEAPEAAILSCVVPTLSEPWRQALARVCGSRALVVGPGLKTGVRMEYDDPSELGSDRVANIVAAREAYPAPCVVVDLGTSTTFEVIGAGGSFAGGIIAPGVELGARSLAQAAARLPVVEPRAPKAAIGKSTRAAMQSGLVLGEAARVDGLLDAIASELGEEPQVVITGRGAEALARLVRHECVVQRDLTLRGLYALWVRNRR